MKLSGTEGARGEAERLVRGRIPFPEIVGELAKKHRVDLKTAQDLLALTFHRFYDSSDTAMRAELENMLRIAAGEEEEDG